VSQFVVGETMLVLYRSVVGLEGVRRCRQLVHGVHGLRGLRVVTGGDARSVASVFDHADTATTIDYGKALPTTVMAPPAVHDDPARAKIDTTFENAKEAYTSKTNAELLRGYSVFQMCSVRLFVNKNKQVRTSTCCRR